MTDQQQEPKKRRRNRRRRRRSGSGEGSGQAQPKTSIEEATDIIVAEALRERHVEVLDWMCRTLGKPRHVIICEMVRQSVVAENSNFREAMGGGGHSSRDAELLANRLPGRK